MTYQTLKIQIEGRAAHVTLNRPEIRNAFDAKMISELTAAFKDLAQHKECSVVVLRGEGKSFCSGADLAYMKAMADFSLAENEADAQALDQMFWAMRSLPQAVVGRLHGHAMGGALGLTALCDVAAAVNGTQFCFSEARLGLAPAVISPYVLEKMNQGLARRFMLTAEVFGVEDALRSGLIEFSGDEAAVDSFVDSVVKALSANGPDAVRATKNLLREIAMQPSWSMKRAITTKVIAERRVSSEGQEGLRGFLEKRSPSWKTT
jgi:methylglutaconyl-CoA hydratase